MIRMRSKLWTSTSGMLSSVFLCLSSACAIAEDASIELIKNIEGVYKHRFENGLVSGEKYQSEDIIEIVKYTDNSIYFRVSLQFYNGHVCGIYGIAKYEGNAFVYANNADKTEPQACTLKISADKDALHITDRIDANSSSTCRAYCGMRGSLSDYDISRDKKRKIRYLPIILKSRQYNEAVEEFKSNAGSE